MNLGQEQIVSVNGKMVIVGRMTVDILERFVEWVKPQLRDPFEAVERCIDKLPADLAREMVTKAEKKAEEMECLTWEAPLVKKFMQTTRGSTYLVWLLIKDKWPDATINDAFDVTQAMASTEGGLTGFFGEADTPKSMAGTNEPSDENSCTANLTIAPGKSA